MIFIDTGPLIARYLQGDQYHRKSLKLWKTIEKKKLKCITSNFVINETATLLTRWANGEFAAERIVNIYNSVSFKILRTDLNQELAALELMKKYSDHKIGFTDAISFLLMKEQKIQTVFSFDSHFIYAGFKLFSSR